MTELLGILIFLGSQQRFREETCWSQGKMLHKVLGCPLIEFLLRLDHSHEVVDSVVVGMADGNHGWRLHNHRMSENLSEFPPSVSYRLLVESSILIWRIQKHV